MTNKITWINFLHIYQPPWQNKGVLDQVASESYEYLLMLFERYPNFKASLNITGNLVEQLNDYYPGLLKRLQNLVDKGQIELSSSSKYHALLPLLSKSEIQRQIELNQEILAKYFDLNQIKGFYMPEMAYCDQVAKVVKKAGFEWIILDAINYQGEIKADTFYIHQQTKLKVVFRNRAISKSYPAEVIYKKLKQNKATQTIITATDGEIYGHFHKDWQGHLEKILQNSNLLVKTVAQYLEETKEARSINLRSGSWESSELELKQRIPFALWDHPKNKIHQSLWHLVSLATKLVGKYKKDKNWFWARQHLDRGVSSCTFWWASAKKLSNFSSLTWSPDMIDAGAEELVRTIRSLSLASTKEKIKAEKIYLDIKKNTWFTHWSKYNKK
ncbi:MAG: polysaccharide deacetylase family protein [Patescibacteria group bacterium]